MESKCYFENKKSVKDNVIHDIFSIDMVEERNKYEVIENIKNMYWSNRRDHLQTFREVEELKIEPVDDYCARVHLKDNSTFVMRLEECHSIRKKQVKQVKRKNR